MRVCDEERFRQSKRTAAGQRPSMGQDMQKGRRTEIEFLNGLVVREGEKVPSARVRVRESTIVTVGNLGAFAFGLAISHSRRQLFANAAIAASRVDS